MDSVGKVMYYQEGQDEGAVLYCFALPVNVNLEENEIYS